MKFSIHKLHRFAKAAALTAAGALGGSLLGGCADETFKPDTEGMPGVLTVTLTDMGTRADLPLQESTDDERTVNHLQLFAFPVDGEGEFASFVLDNPTPAGMVSGRTYTIEDLKDGKYHIYIVGNMESALAGVTTEEKLKEVIIDHEGLLDGQYRLADGKMNLPMVYEPTNQTGSPNGVVTIDNFKGPRLTAPLKFACVKIAYRILFDNDAKVFNKESGTKPFGKNGFLIKSVKAGNLTAGTALVLNNDHTADVAALSCPAPTYCKYWLERDLQNQDVITPSNPTAEINLSGQYYCYGTIYLPERYRAEVDSRSYLEFTGNQTAPDTKLAYGTDISTVQATGPEAVYTIKLGQRDDNDADGYDTGDYADADGATYSFDRGTYYEVIGRVKTPQSQQLEAEVTLRDWTPHNMAGDLSHTTLEVDKTRAAVTSFENDSIAFSSNVPLENITIAAAEGSLTYEGKPIVTRYYSNDADKNSNQIKLRVNTEIPYSAFGEGAGKIPTNATTTIYIQAGNIRKYIDVSYNVAPIFEITPETAIIPWQDNVADTERTRVFTYRTNLGGATFPGITSGQRYSLSSNGSLYQNNDGELKISYEATSSSEGKLTVVAMKKPAETINFNVAVRPQATGYEYLSTTVKVAVKPPYDTYRIYFRPINDNQEDNFADYSANVPEFFDGYKIDNQNKIRYYIYTQMGQTVNGSIPAEWVWLFTGKWDATNNIYPELCTSSSGGWYRYDLSKSKSGICQAGNDNTTKYPKPGETLIIFTTGATASRHRMAHNNDPGIQLYDYEDGEGYYIYDPLCDPYYKVFDDKPEIEQVLYRIFCKDSKPTGFYINYGGANNNDFTIKNEGANFKVSQKNDKSGQAWWVAEFYAQAPAGNYAKQVKVKFENGQESVLFGGANFYNASNKGISRGIYDVRSKTWTMGSPDLEDSTTRRLWFHTTTWATPTAYAWTYKNNITTNNGAWPGASLVKYGNGWWYIDVSKNLEKVIFSNNTSHQAAEIDITSKDVWYFNHTGTNTVNETSSRP